MTTVSANTPAT